MCFSLTIYMLDFIGKTSLFIRQELKFKNKIKQFISPSRAPVNCRAV